MRPPCGATQATHLNIYIYILPYAWCSIPSLLCVRTDGCVWEGSTAKRKANFKQRLKCQWKVVAAGLVHGCVVLLPTLPKKGEEPRAYSSYMWLACALEHYCHPTVVEIVPTAAVLTIPALFTSVCEQRNVQTVAYLQNKLFSYFPRWPANTVVLGLYA